MADACKIEYLQGAYVQENGIIRNADGYIIGRLTGMTFAEVVRCNQTRATESEANDSSPTPGPAKAGT